MKKQNLIQSLALAAALAMLGGCATNTGGAASTKAGEALSFPDANSAWLKGGTFVNVEQLRRMGRGMTKNQVRELISYPHFGEGLFDPKEWDYLFNFRSGRGDEFVTCQYKVVFRDGVTDSMHWKDPACAGYVQAQPAPVAPVPVPVAAQRFKLNADALFAFDKSGVDDILPEGRRQIEALAADLKGKGGRISSLAITGFTDRLGSAGYNQSLSLARAGTVRDVLVQYGIDRGVIRVAGAGESQPVVACPGERETPALVACLQPNRRVEIEVQSER